MSAISSYSGSTDREQTLEHGARVVVHQQRPVARRLGALQLSVDGRLQIDHGARAREPLAVGGIEHRAAARRDDHAVERREVRDHFALALAEALLALFLEDVADVDAGALLDLGVAVEELLPEQGGEALADGGLARAHRADQVKVSFGHECAAAGVCRKRLSKQKGRRNGRPRLLEKRRDVSR